MQKRKVDRKSPVTKKREKMNKAFALNVYKNFIEIMRFPFSALCFAVGSTAVKRGGAHVRNSQNHKQV